MNDKVKLGIALVAYSSSVYLANYMSANFGQVGVGFGLTVSAGTFAAGLALFVRDFVHRYGGVKWAFLGIALGAVVSWFLASPALAVASAVAFAGAELVDLGVFAKIKSKVGFIRAIIISNVISAPLDTVIFLQLSHFGVTWEGVIGQFIGKIVWATLVPVALFLVASRRPVVA